jgi:hypothetical protein
LGGQLIDRHSAYPTPQRAHARGCRCGGRGHEPFVKRAGPLGWLWRALAVATAVLWASHARAQDAAVHAIRNGPWSPYSASVYTEGEGLPIGERQALHIGAALEGGYDSNVFYRRPQDAIGAGLLRLRSRINLATRPPADADQEIRAADPEIAYKLPLQVDFRQYFGSDDARAQSLLNLLAEPALTIWPAGPVTIVLADTFIHTVDPRNAETFAGFFARDTNQASLVSHVRIGGGRLELGAGGSFQTTLWESNDVRYANYTAAEAQTFARWHFDTELAAALRLRGGYVRYGDPVLDSRPLRALLVVDDKLSRWLRVSVGAGYGNSFNVAGASFSGPLATTEVTLTTPWEGTFSLSYERDFFQSLFANFYTDDHLMLGYAHPFKGDFTARAEGGVRWRQYQDLLAPTIIGYLGYNASARNDTIYEGKFELAYRPRPWFTAALTYNVQVDDTSFAFVTADGAVEARYVKHSILLRGEFGN